MAMEQEFDLERFVGERVDFYAHDLLADFPVFADNMTTRQMASQSIEGMVLLIRTWCVAGKVPSRSETEDVHWPDGWWQTLKHDHMPRWFVRRFPVAFQHRTIEKNTYHYFVCPHVRTPDNRQHIIFMATGSPLASHMGGIR